jgi:hypothetical protein
LLPSRRRIVTAAQTLLVRRADVELYEFFRGALAWIATVAVLWPVNVPLAALAYKIQNGARPLDIGRDELWFRSVIAAGLLALVTAGFILLDYVFIDITGFLPGPIHLVIFMGYIPAAAYVMTLSFAFSELGQGLGVLVIYLGLPLCVLFVVHAILGVWETPLEFAYGFLKPPE